MNKMVKGSVAGAAGVALLMGGFGTYATWQDEERLDGVAVRAGVLDIDTTAGEWQDISTGSSTDWAPGDLIVPGDTLQLQQVFDVTATGANMSGVVTFGRETGFVKDDEFAEHLRVETEVVASDTDDVLVTDSETGAHNFTFDGPFGKATLTATVTLSFDVATPARVAQDAAASIDDAVITITQVRP